MTEVTTQEKSALDYFGGFDAYQQRLYETIAGGILNLTVRNLLWIEDGHDSGYIRRIPGLENGLADFITHPVYVTQKISSCLETPLNFGKLSVLGDCKLNRDREYWVKTLGVSSNIESYVKFRALDESDRIAKQKNASGEKPSFKRFVISNLK